ncbi:hypothetical protein BDZ89DRAFT_1201013 [Hymenopellis radicata]|nr:hypothetical protein BDZ89DRAFT_1201013 [Hymenopellis radicata]
MPGAVNLNRSDIGRLGPGEFLNDNLIEFGLKLWLTKLAKEKPNLFKEVYVFSSFFYGKLKTKKGEEMEGYQQVRRWTSKVDIFSKKYLFVPINENYHWYLAVICNPQHVLLPPPEHHSPSTRAKQRQAEQAPSRKPTTILTLDSLGSPHPKAVNILAAYLCMEAQDKLQMANTSKAVGKSASVPVQPNFCDCGLYLIHFVETFMSDPDHYFDVSHAVCILASIFAKTVKLKLCLAQTSTGCEAERVEGAAHSEYARGSESAGHEFVIGVAHVEGAEGAEGGGGEGKGKGQDDGRCDCCGLV